MSVTFTKGGTSVTLPNPERSNVYTVERAQVQERSAAGTLFVYDKGLEILRMELEFRELDDAQKSDIESFFRTTVTFGLSTFTYTDHEGASWTARLVQTSLSFTEYDDDRSDTGNYGVWEVKMVLEVTVS